MLSKSTKIYFNFLFGLFALLIYLYIGSISFSSGTEMHIVIYKYPSINKQLVYKNYVENEYSTINEENWINMHVFKILECGDTGNFMHAEIFILSYGSLFISILFFINLYRIIKKSFV